jgi:hypothetical protein
MPAKGYKRGSSPFPHGSSRYFFTYFSQRNVFVRDIKGHVSQSNGYAAYFHQHDPEAESIGAHRELELKLVFQFVTEIGKILANPGGTAL